MPDKDETLANLRENRLAFKERVAAVDADLAKERERRLGVYVDQIRNLVLRSYAEGANKAQIMRAYGTSDFRTIDNILRSGEAEVESIKEQIVEAEKPSWFRIESNRLYVAALDLGYGEAFYYITELQGREFLLIGDGPMDGTVLYPTINHSNLAELYAAIDAALP
jgi:hypothetical protein